MFSVHWQALVDSEHSQDLFSGKLIRIVYEQSTKLIFWLIFLLLSPLLCSASCIKIQFLKIALYTSIDGDLLSQKRPPVEGCPLERERGHQKTVVLIPVPWEEEEDLNHKPRCSGNLLSLCDGLEHGAMSEASKYSSGWVIMTDAELALLRELKWELWQCLNAMASGLKVFLGQDRERRCRVMEKTIGTTLARKSCCLGDTTTPSEGNRHPTTHQLF